MGTRDDAVQTVRKMKSQPEIDLYRQAGETASRGHQPANGGPDTGQDRGGRPPLTLHTR